MSIMDKRISDKLYTVIEIIINSDSRDLLKILYGG